jgi:hypothetical protein
MIMEFASLAFKPSDSELDKVREWGGEACRGWNEKVSGIFLEAAVAWKLESKKTRRWGA